VRNLLAVAALLFAVCAHAQPKLTVNVIPSTLIVNPQTNSASATIVLTNDGDSETTLLLMADDFVADGSTHGMGTKTVFGEKAEVPAKAVVAPKTTVTVRMDVSNLWQAGAAKSRLMNGAKELVKLAAIRNDVLFNVAPVGWKADTPLALRFESGAVPHIDLKNDDPQTYDIIWSVSAPGLKEQSNTLRLGGGSTDSITLSTDGWLPGRWDFGAILRDQESDGALRLAAVDPAHKETWKSRQIPLKIQRSYWSATQRSMRQFLLIAILVTAGGAASLFVTHWIPNRMRRIAVRELIDSASPKIRALTNAVHSSLRVGVRVERTRLMQRLNSRSAISPDFAALAAECEGAAKRLIREIDMLERVDQLMREIETKWPATGLHGPTLLRRASTLLHDAQVVLDRAEVNDAVVTEAEALIQQAETTIDNAQTLDEAAKSSVAERVKKLRALLKTPGALSGKEPLKAILEGVPALRVILDAEQADLDAREFSEIDTGSTSLDLVKRLIEDSEGIDPTVMDGVRAMFVQALRSNTFSDFRRAENLTAEVREKVFFGTVKQAIEKGELQIAFEPQSPKVNQAVSFTLDFHNARLNKAAALRAISCEWEFDHAAAPEDEPGVIRRAARWVRKQWRKIWGYTAPPAPRLKWTEKGLSISHYFPAAETFSVVARFRDQNGEPIMPANGELKAQVHVAGSRRRPFGERTKIEFSRLVIVLLITVAGLLVGARDELAKLDLIPGLIAVFMLGFTADQIKNILGPPPAP
jgi:hypothetical protein